MFDFLPDWAKASLSVLNPSLALSAFSLGSLLPQGSPELPKPLTPPPPPDAADAAVGRARIAQRRRLLMGEGMGSLFVSGPLGDSSGSSGSTPSLGGF